MKMRVLAAILALALLLALIPALGEGTALGYRFADADEAAELLLANRTYYENMNQMDIDFRLQRKGGTLEELEAFAAEQTRDFTDQEKAAIDGAMAFIEDACARQGYTLPPLEDIVFCKTTMEEECGAGGYTHETQIYLGEQALSYGLMANDADAAYFREIVTHEVFHCLTRAFPQFRAAMYAILGFTVEDADYDLPQAVWDRVISNPDVAHHDSHAAFIIGGEPVDCVVLFTCSKPFEKAGDSFFGAMETSLVPVDDLSTVYTKDDAENFWEVFGENTTYVIDPEETMADNFAYTAVYGLEGKDYATPEIIQAIDAYLKSPSF